MLKRYELLYKGVEFSWKKVVFSLQKGRIQNSVGKMVEFSLQKAII